MNKKRSIEKDTKEKILSFPSNNPNPVLKISKDFILTYCNKEAKNEIKKIHLKIGKKVPSEWISFLRVVWKKKKMEKTEFLFKDKLYILNIVPLTERKEFVIYGTDITEMEKDRKNLKRIENLYNNVVNKNIDSFYICDVTGRFILVNDAFCKLLGYSRKALLKKSIQDLEVKENKKDVKTHIKKVIRLGSDRFESILRKNTGKKVCVEVSSYFIREEKIFFVFLRDISDRKMYEKRLKDINQKLERKIKDLEKFNRISVGREIKMIELKKRIKELEKKER
ncbi:MAG: PAS domain-containing protein [Candidatus Aenigmarchaeota archaeon]|nr:PAS domain-containing protein [Candidatus Aenigmarchaeota archaeon]